MTTDNARSFVHLHVHTQYSLLDGAIRIQDLMKRCGELGMSAVAMTDHGNMYGAVDFQKSAKKAGLKPIIGCELYVSEGPRTESTTRKAYHLTVLAKDLVGYRNLMYIVSMAWLDGRHETTKLPRVDRALLAERSEGLIALTGDLAGEVNQAVLRGKMDEAREVLRGYQEIFGEDLYLEVMDAPLEEFRRSREGLIALSRETGVPLVATNDCHYLKRDDALAHAILMCIQLGKSVDPEQVLSHGLDTLYVKSAEEMWEAFADVPEACANTVKIAEMIDLEIPLGEVFLPRYGVPEEFKAGVETDDPDEVLDLYFAHLSREGLKKRFEAFERYGVAYDEEVYRARLEEEVGIIQQMNFAGYFLIVWDFINYARRSGVPVGPGRGSGAGSLVAYCLEITDIDPLKYDLLFERFLNPERVSMPDFDIDFCMNRRGEVIDYVTQKYGAHNVGQIITYGQLKPRACVKDVGRALGLSFGETDRIAKLIPDELGITLTDAFDKEPRLKGAAKDDPRLDTLYDIALKLENLNRQAGMHAAGIVISEGPIWDYVPICRGANDEIVTQFAKNEVEEAGLVKFDFLGLKTLTVIDTALRLINQQRGEGEAPFDIGAIPMDDREVFEMISRGDTTGVFQLESSGFQTLLQKLKPDVFEDIVAAVALYRPGPLGTGMVDDFINRKHGRQEISYPHPWLEETLKETYGTIVYQEQVMKIAQVMAGYSLGGADLLRRAMGKKKKSVMDEQRQVFVKGALEREVPEEKSNEVFDLMAYFAGYGFNKCVVGETEVMDACTGETTTVGDLFRRRRPFRVHALDEHGKLNPRDVTDVVWNGVREVFTLRTEQGHRITATGNHPFRTLDGWTNLEDLKVGQLIAVPRKLHVETTRTWPEHELVVLAGLLSEGNTCHPSCLYFYNNDAQAVDDFVQAASRFPNTVARIATREDSQRMEVCLSTGRDARFRKGMTPWNVSGAVALKQEEEDQPRRSGAYLWAQALEILDKTATEKRVPKGVFTLRDEDIALFLGRLWAGDGFFANATQAVPYYATSSRQLAYDVQLLLRRLGIMSGVHAKTFKYRGGERDGYTVHLVGDGSRQRFLDRVAPHAVGRDRAVRHLRDALDRLERRVSSKDLLPVEIKRWVQDERQAAGLTWSEVEARSGVSMKCFTGKATGDKRGFRRSTIATLAEFFDSSRLRAAACSDVFWDRITRIEPQGRQHTYDLTVDVDHNFVADGIVVHNSHSAAYALITYQTGYLKAHYPVEFMAALMTCDRENTDKVVRFIQEAKGMGIQVLPPDVNASALDFVVVDRKILFGLGAIKGAGELAIEAVLKAREAAGGAFRSLYDFCERVDLKRVNKRVLEAMIKSGALDSVGLTDSSSPSMFELASSRARMLAALEPAMKRGQKAQKDRSAGQATLFGMLMQATPVEEEEEAEALDYYPDVQAWTDKELLANERASLGFYVTGHPLDRYQEEVSRYATHNTLTIQRCPVREQVTLAGVVSSMREKVSKSGKGRMAFLEFEDTHGSIEVLCFSSSYSPEAEEVIKSDVPLLLTGHVAIDGEGESTTHKLRLSQAALLTDARRSRVSMILVDLDGDRLGEGELEALAEILRAHPGSCRTELHLKVRVGEVRGVCQVVMGEEFAADPSDAMLMEVERLFQARVVRME